MSRAGHGRGQRRTGSASPPRGCCASAATRWPSPPPPSASTSGRAELGARGYVADLTDWEQAERLVAAGRPDRRAGQQRRHGPDRPPRGAVRVPRPGPGGRGSAASTSTCTSRSGSAGSSRRRWPSAAGAGSSTSPPSPARSARCSARAAYGAAKAGVDGLTRALALELGPRGVTVNSVAPGWIATGPPREEEIEAGRRTPVGRPGTPEEVAELIAFLASAGRVLHHRPVDRRRRRQPPAGAQGRRLNCRRP